ncbi:UDP-N-acetylmuramoylalanine--D-glutamate ligase [Candidatus Terasakiella magnetica]|uniref:UDP-N-acetylmuramoylalanine--D-glutamate ligase n=1 Tax=Candidatus Terasakiella magnetica TaxID=1867952 RepID=A0A1C3RJF8_9PROT|nr:UDP-N-acetylmuramoyl-L-alanine--D-glutamate ligase [Candidatus Terasakiella magnetica]SCA57412.1 UDP-N-acetylmuramoylalanine--D-glutamate ligase [Candidatus Terasakiella magnetica]
MIIPTTYKGKTVAVLGLGKSGLSAMRALKEAGATVLAWDDTSERDDLIDLTKADWNTIDLLVMSPGIPHTFPTPHPVAELARAHNVAIVCDVELLIQAQPQAKYIAITGTNGKSTTTALIAHILDVAGLDVEVGGNLGIPALDLEALDEDGVYVLELSSYQLERTPSLCADVAVWLNISADHLDRHGGLEGYIAAKKNIFANQSSEQFAIIGIDDEHSAAVFNEAELTKAKRIAISATGPVDDGIFSDEDVLIDEAFCEDGEQVMDLSSVRTLQGRHNQQNAATAYAACVGVGAAPEWIVRGIASFPGLEHRQEIVTTVNGVLFINDSKATNADATSKALGAYEDIYWIAGGQAKEGGIEQLLSELGGIKKAYLIGEAEKDFAKTLEGQLKYQTCQTLDVATKAAFADAKENGGVILLSPACASWDQFKSFEARGDAFKEIVAQIQEGEAA